MDRLSVWLCNTSPRRWILDFITKKCYAKYFNTLKDKEVLEIGCGSGWGTTIISKYFSPLKIVATDLDERQIVLARKNVKNKNIIFETAEAVVLPYQDNSFDAVFEYGTIHHISSPDWQKCLTEVYRVLKSDGKFFVYDVSIESFQNSLYGKIIKATSLHPYERMYQKEEFVKHLSSIGFKIAKRFDGYRYFAIIAEK